MLATSDTATQVEAFRRDGYLHAPGLIAAGEIAELRAAVDEAVAWRTRQDRRGLAEKSPFEQSFTMCQYLWEDFAEVGRLTFHPAVCGLAAALIGAPRLRLWHDQALYKEAGGRETEMHQDQPYWPIAERDTITAWMALVDIDETMGPMGYIPGSHKGDVTFIDVFTTPGQGKDFEARQAREAIYVPCKAGDVLFHHGSTIHAAKSNRTDRVRRVMTGIYFKDGCTRQSGRAHFSVDRDGIEVGAPIAGRATPIAWPLAGGALPQPAPFPSSGIHPKLGEVAHKGIFPEAR